MYYFYILRCKDGSLYCGSTNDVARREERHNSGQGSVYVRTHGGGKMIYRERFKTLPDAMRREIQVKRWSQTKKENLIKGLTP